MATLYDFEEEEPEVCQYHLNNGIGDAGELLVLAHLKALGYECGKWNGKYIDVLAHIGGCYRGFQVKASKAGTSFGYDPDAVRTSNIGRRSRREAAGGRSLMHYKGKVDAIAFY